MDTTDDQISQLSDMSRSQYERIDTQQLAYLSRFNMIAGDYRYDSMDEQQQVVQLDVIRGELDRQLKSKGIHAAEQVNRRKKKKQKKTSKEAQKLDMHDTGAVSNEYEVSTNADQVLSIRQSSPMRRSNKTAPIGEESPKTPVYFDPKRIERLAKPILYKTYNYDPLSDPNNPLNMSNRTAVVAYSDPERVLKLSKSTAGKFERTPQPPKYCLDYPLLPFEPVDKLHQLNNTFAVLPTNKYVECIRFTVTTEVKKNWKEETNLPNRSFSQKRSNTVEKRPAYQDIDFRRLQSKISSKSVNRRDLSSFQYGEFSKKFSVGFVIVVLDVFMQVIGTYDPSMGMFVPGVTLAPPFLTKKIAKAKLKINRANLMEIEFAKLPTEAFAVVPVFVDESYIHPQHKHTLPTQPSIAENGYTKDPTAITFTCDLFMKSKDPLHNLPPHLAADRRELHLAVHSEMTKEEAERFLPQDYLMAQCDGVEDLWFKIAGKRKMEEKLMVQRLLRLIHRRMHSRTHVARDSFLTNEQIRDGERKFDQQPMDESVWTHYCRFRVNRSYMCDPSIKVKTPSGNARAANYMVGSSSLDVFDDSNNNANSANRVNGRSGSISPVDSPHYRKGSTVSYSNSTNNNSSAVGTRRNEVTVPLHMQNSTNNSGAMKYKYTSSPSTPQNQEKQPKLDRKRTFLKPPSMLPDLQSLDEDEILPSFGVGDAFVPFILFRKTIDVEEAEYNYETESYETTSGGNWAVLPTQAKIATCHQRIDIITRFAVDALSERGVLPFHMIHVEHCVDCEKHKCSTRHIPGQYEKIFSDLRSDLKLKLPPSLIFNNLPSIIAERHSKSNHPEMGSFEVAVRPYNTLKSTIVFSKVSRRSFPTAAEIVERLSDLLLPEQVEFIDNTTANDATHKKERESQEVVRRTSSKPVISILILDGYSQRPLVHAEVLLFQMRTNISFPRENLELSTDIQRKGIFEPKSTPSFSNAVAAFKSNSKIGMYRSSSFESQEDDVGSPIDGNGDGSGELGRRRRSRSPSRRVSRMKALVDEPVLAKNRHKQTLRPHSPSENNPSASMPSLHYLPTDYSMRHSVGFAKVRAWSEVDVVKWLSEHGADPNVIARAKTDGVIDGQSLLTHLTARNLEKWGVKSRIQILKYIKGLAHICADNNSDLRQKLESININTSFEQLCQQEQDTPVLCQQVRRSQSPTNNVITSSSSSMPSSSWTGVRVLPQYQGLSASAEEGNRVEFTHVTSAYSDVKGMLNIDIDQSGTYFLKICHSSNRDFYSHAFSITKESVNTRLIHSVCLKPKLSLLMCVIRFSSIDELDAFPFFSFLTAVLNTKSGKRHVIFTEYWSKEFIDNEYLFIGECWLPIGRYVCGVTGEQFILDNPSKEQNNEWRDLIPQYYEQFPLDKTIFAFKASQAMRLHRNLLHRALHKCQRLYRQIRANKTIQKVRDTVSAHKKMRKYFEYIRIKLRNKAATKIQKVFRGYQSRKEFQQIKGTMVSLQALWRGFSARSNLLHKRELSGVLFFINSIISRRKSVIAINKLRQIDPTEIIKYNSTNKSGKYKSGKANVSGKSGSLILDAIRSRRYQAAVIIQCNFRLYLSRKQLLKSIQIKRAKLILRYKFLQFYRQKVERMRELRRIRNRECYEISLMSIEDKLIRNIMKHYQQIKQKQRQTERFKMEEITRKLEANKKQQQLLRHQKAADIQRVWRGHKDRQFVRSHLKTITRLQHFLKSKIIFWRYKEEKLRKMKANNMKRLTATDRSGGPHRRRSSLLQQFKRRQPSVLQFANRLRRTMSMASHNIRTPQRNSTLSLVTALVERKVVLIQSMWRMRRTRKRYLAKRRALGSRHVPLYRQLTGKPRTALSINDDANDNSNNDNASHVSDISSVNNNSLVNSASKGNSNGSSGNNKKLFDLFKSKTEEFSKLLIQQTNQINSNIHQYFQNKQESKRLEKERLQEQKRKQREETYQRKLHGIIKLQATVRGVICRYRLYKQQDVRSLVKKLVRFDEVQVVDDEGESLLLDAHPQKGVMKGDNVLVIEKTVVVKGTLPRRGSGSEEQVQKLKLLPPIDQSTTPSRPKAATIAGKFGSHNSLQDRKSRTAISNPSHYDNLREDVNLSADDQAEDEHMQQYGDMFYSPETADSAAIAMNYGVNDSDASNLIDSPERFRPNLTVKISSNNLRELRELSGSKDDIPESALEPNLDTNSVISNTSQRATNGSSSNSNSNHVKSLSSKMSKATAKLSGKLLDTATTATKALNEAKTKAIEATNAYLLRKKLDAERENRRRLGQVNISDALLNIRGTLVSDIPTVERKWYIKAFPKASYTQVGGVEVDAITESWKDNALLSKFESKQSDSVVGATVGSDPTLSSASNMTNKTPTESTQSMTMFPFSIESVNDVSMFLHLTDLTRYKSIEIVIYIENNTKGSEDRDSLGPKSSAANGNISRDGVDGSIPTVNDVDNSFTYGNNASGNPNNSQAVANSLWGAAPFVPLFYGECFIGRGSAFGPQGGRMFLKVIPNNFHVLRVPHGRRLQAMGGIPFLITLLPIAMPSTHLLRTFRGHHRGAPAYPNVLCDCECLEPVNSLTWDALYGGAVASSVFRGGRILVSVRKKGAPRGLVEFDSDGHLIGTMYDSAETIKLIGTITLLVSGCKHIVCCGSTGYLMVIREDKETEPKQKRGHLLHDWIEQPLIISAFQDAHAVCGCALVHAGLDFFFLVANTNEICVAVLDNGECFRCAVNNSFFISPIRSIVACSPFVYIALADGDVYTLNLSVILEDGDIDMIGYLHRYIVAHEAVFANRSGITSMCVVAPSTFLNLKNEDELQSLVMARNSNKSVKKFLGKPQDDSYLQEHLEGHILLVGGGDEDPTIKVFHPKFPGGFKELVNLSGHKMAVTQLLADACMRYIVSASTQERKILIWDGYTFNCERIIEDVSIGTLTVGEDCMVVTTSKAPFLRIWNVPRNKHVVSVDRPRVADRNLEDVHYDDEQRCRDIEAECGIKHHNIVSLRSSSWCYSMLKGGFRPKKSIEIPSYLDPIYVQVLWRWAQQYSGSRMDAPESTNQVNQRRADRKNRLNAKFGQQSAVVGMGFLSSPPTPLAIRKAETPRARARRRFEKDQIGSMLHFDNILSSDEPNQQTIDNSIHLATLDEGDEEGDSGKGASIKARSNLNQFLNAATTAINNTEFDDDDEEEPLGREQVKSTNFKQKVIFKVSAAKKAHNSEDEDDYISPDESVENTNELEASEGSNTVTATLKKKRYKPQFGLSVDSDSEEDKELVAEINSRRQHYEEIELAKIRKERQATIRPKGFQHMTDVDNDD